MTNKTFLLINRKSGKALQSLGIENGVAVEQSQVNYCDAQLWSKATISKSSFKLVNKATDKVLDVMYNGTVNGTWTHTWEDVNGPSQEWRFDKASRGFRKIVNVTSEKVLDIHELSVSNGAVAQLWEDVNGENQEWKIVEYPAPAKRISAKKIKTAI
ncbi:MAG: RICIN domain-containing protein [Clostridia bacterium]